MSLTLMTTGLLAEAETDVKAATAVDPQGLLDEGEAGLPRRRVRRLCSAVNLGDAGAHERDRDHAPNTHGHTEPYVRPAGADVKSAKADVQLARAGGRPATAHAEQHARTHQRSRRQRRLAPCCYASA